MSARQGEGRVRGCVWRLAMGMSLLMMGCGGGAGGAAASGSNASRLLQADAAAGGGLSLVVPVDDHEVLGPFATWADARRDYGAKGDGVSDDTDALQQALDDLGPKTPGLYLPAGRYRITRSLQLKGSPTGGFWLGGVNIMGESPDTTRIVWAGAVGEPMLVQDGGFNTRYSRITWDGQGRAGYGVAHWWNAQSGRQFDGSPEHTDEVFTDMGIGIMAGRMGAAYGQMNSEGQVRRVRFVRMSQSGVNTGSWNALNWWVWESRFTDCARGVSNVFTVGDVANPGPGAGAVHVYRSVFERSTVSDVHIANTGFFSMQHNVSSGSRRFFVGEGMGTNNASIVIQGNRILDTIEAAAIVNGNLGPLILIDNDVRSASGNTSAAVVLNDWEPGRDVISVGNRYTVSAPIKTVDDSDRVLSVDDSVVEASSLASTMPAVWATPARPTRQVFEVESGTGNIAIQAAVNAAVAAARQGAVNPVVHIPAGSYKMKGTVVVPPNVALQIAGDGLLTQLNWAGSVQGSVFRLEGPSRATLRDVHVIAPAPTAYLASVTQADQADGRIFIMGSSPGVLSATGLAQTRVALQANTGFTGLELSGVASLASMGAGGMGRTVVRDGSRALVADTWYEGADTRIYDVRSGAFTYLNGHLAPATHSGSSDLSQAVITLDGLAGQASFVGFSVNTDNIPSHVALRVTNETADTRALFLGASAATSSYLDRPGSGGQVGLVMSKGSNSAGKPIPLNNQGSSDAAFLRTMLAQARALQWEAAQGSRPTGSTDVHIYRVHASQTLGLQVSAD